MTLHLGGRGLVFAALLATDFFSLARLSSLVAENRRRLDRSRIPLLSDLKFMETGAEIFIKWGKSHQDPADGFWVRLQPVEGSPACPVVLLRVLKLTLWGASPCFPVRLQGGGQPGAGCAERGWRGMHQERICSSLGAGAAER